MQDRTCDVPECGHKTRSPGSALCGKHYHRQYRHGSLDKTAESSGISVSHGRRYVSRYLPRHPLATASGKVYVHRAVLYDTIGAGPHRCHWCAQPVTWAATRGQIDCLTVDHLNGVGDDNRPENLVPSCLGCNVTRAVQARARALRQAGWWSGHDTVAGLKSGGRHAEIEPAA